MAAPGGPARYELRRAALLSVASLAVVAATAACGTTTTPGATVGNQAITKPPAAAAVASSGAGLSPGMTIAPVPPAPPAPDSQGVDGCLGQGPKGTLTNGMLECQYFTSGSMVPASMSPAPGLSSGDYAIRFGRTDGLPLMTVRIPCASYSVRVSIVGQEITPDPGTLESHVGTCDFPWDEEQQRMAQYLQSPLQFVQQDAGIALHNYEWGVSLLRTPYEAP